MLVCWGWDGPTLLSKSHAGPSSPLLKSVVFPLLPPLAWHQASAGLLDVAVHLYYAGYKGAAASVKYHTPAVGNDGAISDPHTP